MNELTLDLLQKLCDNNCIIWSAHATERLQLRGIHRNDVIHAIQCGKIIEQYPDDHPYPSCLVLGLSLQGRTIHVVCGSEGTILKIITAYYPSEDKFDTTGEYRKEKQS